MTAKVVLEIFRYCLDKINKIWIGLINKKLKRTNPNYTIKNIGHT